MTILRKGPRINITIIAWDRNTQHPKYEETYVIWKGIARADEAIETAVCMVDDEMHRGAWVIKGRGKEIIAKLHRDKLGVEVTKY